MVRHLALNLRGDGMSLKDLGKGRDNCFSSEAEMKTKLRQ